MSEKPIRILLQTTIATTSDDWWIGRFDMLRTFLSEQTDAEGAPLFEVVARDRDAPGEPDSVLSTLDTNDFDELWLFAIDTGDGLTKEDCAGIGRFRHRGGGMMVTRDHMDLGSSICTLGGVGKAHHFHTRNLDPDEARRLIDDTVTTDISWPNYHSGANGDLQKVTASGAPHPVLLDPASPIGVIRTLPAHPHEGAVSAPADEPTARVVATGTSKTSGKVFNLAVAFEPADGDGPAIAQSTFHHFADYNWDPSAGAPSFVSEPPGDEVVRDPAALNDTHRYVRNMALWLAGRAV